MVAATILTLALAWGDVETSAASGDIDLPFLVRREAPWKLFGWHGSCPQNQMQHSLCGLLCWGAAYEQLWVL